MIASSLKFQINLDVNALTKFTFSREKIKKKHRQQIEIHQTRAHSKNQFAK